MRKGEERNEKIKVFLWKGVGGGGGRVGEVQEERNRSSKTKYIKKVNIFLHSRAMLVGAS